MKNTPIHDIYNTDLLNLIPPDSSRVIEVGCSSGALAKAFLAMNPRCEYIGIEHDPAYAELAKRSCARVIQGSIEQLDNDVFEGLFPSDCWVFGDVLEHLFDPWAVLERIRSKLDDSACVLACIPNAQHWSVQARLNTGSFRYEEAGLLDRTHIRWFTRTTIIELFESCGYMIAQGEPRIFDEPNRDAALAGIRRMAESIGADPNLAVNDALPLQWLIKALPA